MKILAFETSCDETAVSVVENGITVLSSVISSSRGSFAEMGGVIPEQAARKQVEFILPALTSALQQANVTIMDIDAIAVTKGPGLLVSLLVGVTTARTLASIWNKPLIGVNHTLGHMHSTLLGLKDTIQFPIVTLSISGGHTELWLRDSHTIAKKIAETRDDAVGEAFDKGAKLLGLPYPGGPAISAFAATGNSNAYMFPSPLRGENTFDWSFSGLKTALRYTIRDNEDANKEDIAASYEAALCQHLQTQLLAALAEHSEVQEVHIVGGVSANIRLRSLLEESLEKYTVQYPLKLEYCTDNAAMIGSAAYFLVQEQGEAAYEAF